MSQYWINKLNESDSRLHKEGVIQDALNMANLGHTDSQIFLALAKATYNPFVTFGIKQIPITEGVTDAENPWSDYNELLSKLHSRVLTGHAARDAVEAMSLRFDSGEWNTMCRPVILKDLRAGISEKTINKVCKKTQYEIPVFGCQLATSGDDRPEMKGVKRLEPKLDGVRTLFVVDIADTGTSVTCYSRNGKVFENFDHICQSIADTAKPLSVKSKLPAGSLEQGFVLDGEVVGKSFNDLMKQARRKTDVQATDSTLYVFDVLPLADFRRGYWNAQLEKRIAILDAMRPVIDQMSGVDLLPHINVDLDTAAGKDQFHRYCQDKVAEGFEGVMIKELKAPYICKRSTDWMKYKPTITVDLSIISVEEGTGKYAGSMGAILCSGVDDGRSITVSVGSGFTDAQRAELWQCRDELSGRVVEVIADAVSQNQDGGFSLRFPRFYRFRDSFTGEKE
jgi:DNA ligase-1